MKTLPEFKMDQIPAILIEKFHFPRVVKKDQLSLARESKVERTEKKLI